MSPPPFCGFLSIVALHFMSVKKERIRGEISKEFRMNM